MIYTLAIRNVYYSILLLLPNREPLISISTCNFNFLFASLYITFVETRCIQSNHPLGTQYAGVCLAKSFNLASISINFTPLIEEKY